MEELGLPYDMAEVDVNGGATHTPEFLSINPKGKVPTLVQEDGSVLTEFGAIATWLGHQKGTRVSFLAIPSAAHASLK
jgi:glutathione S-transferase